jgi:hypothetical protein
MVTLIIIKMLATMGNSLKVLAGIKYIWKGIKIKKKPILIYIFTSLGKPSVRSDIFTRWLEV